MLKMSMVMCLALAPFVGAASAQTANSSPTAPSPGSRAGAPSTSTTGPSGGATGQPAAGAASGAPAETELDRQEDLKQKKATTICKGC